MNHVLVGIPKMSERFYGLNVFLEKPIDLEAVAAIIAAIKLIKGVASVQPLQHHPDMYWAKEKARSELSNAMWEALNREGIREIDVGH